MSNWNFWSMTHTAKDSWNNADSRLMLTFKWDFNSHTIVTKANFHSPTRHRWRVFSAKVAPKLFDHAQSSRLHGWNQWIIQQSVHWRERDCLTKHVHDIRSAIKMQCAAVVSIDICSVSTLCRNILRSTRRFWRRFSASHGGCRHHKRRMVRRRTWIWRRIPTAFQRVSLCLLWEVEEMDLIKFSLQAAASVQSHPMATVSHTSSPVKTWCSSTFQAVSLAKRQAQIPSSSISVELSRTWKSSMNSASVSSNRTQPWKIS